MLSNWYWFVPPFSKFWKGKRIMRFRDGLVLKLREMDWFAVNQIIRDDVYHLGSLRTPPNKVVDVGAHIGIFSLLIARKFPEAAVFAIEPESENYSLLEENIKLNALTNVKPIKAAVAESYGKMKLHVSKQSALHSLYTTNDATGFEELVDTYPLVHFGAFDMLKVDAEGAEYHILKVIPNCKYVAFEASHGVPGVSDESRLELLTRFEKQMNSLPERRNVHVYLKRLNTE